jgi:death-on-curing protein
LAILFLSLAEVLAVHEDMVRRYGGSLGLRDLSLLESAVGMPEATFNGNYLHEGIAAMAAAYCFHLVANHSFLDGNKRAGAAAANVFLELNGWRLDASSDLYADFILAIAAGQADKRVATDFFQLYARPVTG